MNTELEPHEIIIAGSKTRTIRRMVVCHVACRVLFINSLESQAKALAGDKFQIPFDGGDLNLSCIVAVHFAKRMGLKSDPYVSFESDPGLSDPHGDCIRINIIGDFDLIEGQSKEDFIWTRRHPLHKECLLMYRDLFHKKYGIYPEPEFKSEEERKFYFKANGIE